MAKSKVVKKKSISIEGILDIDVVGGLISIEIEEIGTKDLASFLSEFHDETVKISVALSSDVTE